MSGEPLAEVIAGCARIAIGVAALIFLRVTTRLMRESIDAAIRVCSTFGIETSDQWRDATVGILRIAMPILTVVVGVMVA